MSKEQLDAVRDELLAEKDNDLRQTFLNTFLEDAEKGAGMIIVYAAKKDSRSTNQQKKSLSTLEL